ncbi:MAG: GxxExxY protein [Pyrinomonadaceae bacterium]
MDDLKTNEQFRHSDLTRDIIGTFYEVYNELGHGFIESVYENALCITLRKKGLEVHQQGAVPVWFRGQKVGDFDADVMVNRLVLLELKVARTIEQAHIAQLLNYLKATPIEVGLLLNFGPRPEFKRVVFGNDRKSGEPKEPSADPFLSALSA